MNDYDLTHVADILKEMRQTLETGQERTRETLKTFEFYRLERVKVTFKQLLLDNMLFVYSDAGCIGTLIKRVDVVSSTMCWHLKIGGIVFCTPWRKYTEVGLLESAEDLKDLFRAHNFQPTVDHIIRD